MNKICVVGFACFATCCSAFCAKEQNEAPVQMAPFQVNEKPYGFLGIKHATVGVSPLKFMVGMNAMRFLQIDELEPQSPGIIAGVLPGDRITSVDGIPITKFGIHSLKRFGQSAEVGHKIVVEVIRPSDGTKRTMEVIVKARPKGV